MQNESTFEREYTNRLHRSGYRSTKTKRQVFEVLSRASELRSMQQIVEEVRGSHFVSVYRSVDCLIKAKIINRVPRGFKNLYELSDVFKPHHHHISCERCGKVVKINSEQLERVIKELSADEHFSLTSHHMELFGLCEVCQK